MQEPIAQPTPPAAVRRLQLVYSAPAAPMRARRDWESQLDPIIRRVINAMTEAHPSTLTEELLAPLRQGHADLPENADQLAGWIAREIRRALPQALVDRDREAVERAALRWLWRMQTNAREPARQQYRDLLAPLA